MAEFVTLEGSGKVEPMTTIIRSEFEVNQIIPKTIQYKKVKVFEKDENGNLTGRIIQDLPNRLVHVSDEALAALVEAGCTEVEINATYKVLGVLFDLSKTNDYISSEEQP